MPADGLKEDPSLLYASQYNSYSLDSIIPGTDGLTGVDLLTSEEPDPEVSLLDEEEARLEKPGYDWRAKALRLLDDLHRDPQTNHPIQELPADILRKVLAGDSLELIADTMGHSLAAVQEAFTIGTEALQRMVGGMPATSGAHPDLPRQRQPARRPATRQTQDSFA